MIFEKDSFLGISFPQSVIFPPSSKSCTLIPIESKACCVGIAKAIFSIPIAPIFEVTTPIISPLLFISGPPLLPGFTGVSVWICFFIPLPLIPLTMPYVMVVPNPIGFPIATTSSPT